MLDYRQLQALATVIEEQSFERAAQRLFLTQSAISQRLKQLEESMGKLLIVRSQPLRPTPAGQQLYRHYQQVSLLQNELLENLQDASDQGYTRLAIGLNADTLATWFLDAIEPVMRNSQILLHLSVDDQDQTLQLLRQGDVIGCISASDQAVQGSSCTPLCTTRYLAVAAPEFIAQQFSDGVSPTLLNSAPAVEFNEKDDLQKIYLKRYWPDVTDYPFHRVPSSEAFVDMIVRGYGWGMVPEQQVSNLLSSGKLRELAPARPVDVPLYWHSWNMSSAVIQAVADALADYCRSRLTISPY